MSRFLGVRGEHQHQQRFAEGEVHVCWPMTLRYISSNACWLEVVGSKGGAASHHTKFMHWPVMRRVMRAWRQLASGEAGVACFVMPADMCIT